MHSQRSHPPKLSSQKWHRCVSNARLPYPHSGQLAEVGEAEANVNRRKIEAYRDPRLFALTLLGEQLSKSAQPLVPERVLLFGQAQENGGASSRIEASGLLSALLGLLVSERSGVNVFKPNDPSEKGPAEQKR